MNKLLKSLLVLSISLVVTLVVAEVALRVLSKYSLRVFDVEMWRYAKAIKIESDVPGVVEEHRAGADELLMGVTVRTDDKGLRRADPATEAARTPNDRLVIALGDSVTFGWGAAEKDTFPTQLENLLAVQCPKEGAPRATVLNAGIGNCNTSMEVKRYEARLRPLKPKWVVLGYSYNDAEPDAVPNFNPFLWNSSLISLASARLQRLSGPYQHYEPYYQGLYQDGLPGWEGTKREIAHLGQMLRQDGIPGTVILLPELHEPKDFGPFKGLFARVTELAKANGFEVIDPSGAFPPGSGERFWVSHEDPHPTAEAHAIYAAALARSPYACR